MIIVKTTFNVSAEARPTDEEQLNTLIEDYRAGKPAFEKASKDFSDESYKVVSSSLNMTVSKDDGATWEEIN